MYQHAMGTVFRSANTLVRSFRTPKDLQVSSSIGGLLYLGSVSDNDIHYRQYQTLPHTNGYCPLFLLRSSTADARGGLVWMHASPCDSLSFSTHLPLSCSLGPHPPYFKLHRFFRFLLVALGALGDRLHDPRRHVQTVREPVYMSHVPTTGGVRHEWFRINILTWEESFPMTGPPGLGTYIKRTNDL